MRATTAKLTFHFSVNPLNLNFNKVYRYINFFERTGEVAPRVAQHSPQKLLGDFEQLVLLRIILENTGNYLHEIQARCVWC